MQVELTPTFLASCAIVRVARSNPAITVVGLQDELERGDIDGWSDIVRRWNLNFSQWSGAMERAITMLENGEAVTQGQQEQKLIEAIKAKPGYQVFPGSNGGSVTIAITRPNGVSQRSVWLGRSSTIANLEQILAA